MVSKKGFTLIELAIVVAIIAILASIAYPSYVQYVKKTKRTDMQANMLQIASQIQHYKIANFKLKDAAATDLKINATYPIQGGALYNVELWWLDNKNVLNKTSPLGSEKWILVATPISTSTQYRDGHIVLNYKGERCWVSGTDNSGTACAPSSSSNWDGK